MLHLRKFNWEHIKVYTDLYNKINSFDFTARLYHKESMGKILTLPGADPESNLVMAYWDGKAVGFTHVVVTQVGTLQVGISQVGTSQVSTTQVGILQVGTTQVHLLQIRPRANILLSIHFYVKTRVE